MRIHSVIPGLAYVTTQPAVRIVELALLLLLASGCSDTFEPFKVGSDLHFSVFGYLNAAADTQWVRVTPIRQSVFTKPGKLDATVTLEDMATGATTELNDSVFGFAPSADAEGAAESWVHNFWTNVPIEYGATYQLSVVGADGSTTTATVPMPDELREVDIEGRLIRTGGGRFSSTTQQYIVRVPAKHVALVEVIHYVANDGPGGQAGTFTPCTLAPEVPRVYSIRQPVSGTTTVGDTTEIGISANLQSGLPGSGCVIGRREVLVASSGSQWPSGSHFSASALTGGGVSLVLDGGVGFVGGVATRTVPFENCTVEPPTAGSSCMMRYNDQSATVEGVVIDSRCRWPVEGATVVLTALGDSPAVVRTTTTDELGHFRIGALVGGTSYAVHASQPLRWPPDYPVLAAYEDFDDTLPAPTAGTTETYNLELRRLVECQFGP